jgi:hypothetical protein
MIDLKTLQRIQSLSWKILKNDTWWEEFKHSGWFSRILLVLPYLLGIAAISMFLLELVFGPTSLIFDQ